MQIEILEEELKKLYQSIFQIWSRDYFNLTKKKIKYLEKKIKKYREKNGNRE